MIPLEEITIKQVNKEVKQLEKNFSRVVAINQQANEEIQQLKTQVEYLVRVNKEVVLLMKDNMFSSTNTKPCEKALSTKQMAERYNMSTQKVEEIFKKKGSPAFKIGDGKFSQWRCMADKFELFLIKETVQNKYKG